MISGPQPHVPAPGKFRRLALVVAGAAVFLGVASVIKPQPRQATAGSQPDTPAMATSPVVSQAGAGNGAQRHQHNWKSLGYIESREFIILAFASPEGPRYTVKTRDGATLQSDLPADEVYRAFPDIDLENLRADPPEGDLYMLHADRAAD